MRHVVVRRLTLLLALLAGVGVAAFTWVVRDGPARGEAAPAGATGALLFERRCTPCHAAVPLGRELQGNPGVRRSWEAFLRDHGGATDAENRLILDYLAGTAGI